MFRARRASLLAAGLMLSAALTGCGGSSSAGGDAAQPDATVTATSGTPVVTIEDFAFKPATLVINAGMKVRFVQQDSVPHNAVGEGASAFIKSPLLSDKGDSYTVEFSTPGSFDYICTIHPRMQGRIIVQ